MKEVLTRSFWEGVKKTFYEALEGPPKDSTPQPPAESDGSASSAPPAPSSPSASSQRP